MRRIFIPQPFPEPAVQRLREIAHVTVFPHLDSMMGESEMCEAVTEAHILLAVGANEYSSAVIDAAPDLELIAAMQLRPSTVDVAHAKARGIRVTNIPNMTAETTAEYTVGLMLATAWRIPEAQQFLIDGRWRQRQSEAFLGTRLRGKTLGVVGAGAIGQRVARLAQAFEMDVIYTKRSQLDAAVEDDIGMTWRSLDDVFRDADIIVVTLGLTPDTRGLVNERLLGLMKPDSLLINTSRGPVVDEAALEMALRNGLIRGAGLDVYEQEIGDGTVGPRPGLIGLPNVVLTPHIGSAARSTRIEMAMRVVENIEAHLDGRIPGDLL